MKELESIKLIKRTKERIGLNDTVNFKAVLIHLENNILIDIDNLKGLCIDHDEHHWVSVGYWDSAIMEQCVKCNLYREKPE